MNEIAIWYAAPFGENVTHGSEARSKSPPFATVPPEQNVNLAKVVFQVAPPLVEYPVARPRAPPSDHRSCCQTPMMLRGFAGLTATQGSTSSLT